MGERECIEVDIIVKFFDVRLTKELSVSTNEEDEQEFIALLEKSADSIEIEKLGDYRIIDLKHLENILQKLGISASKKEVNINLE